MKTTEIKLPKYFLQELEQEISRLLYLEIIGRRGKTYIDKVCRSSEYKMLVRDIEDLKDWEAEAIAKMAKDRLQILSTILPRGGERLYKNDELLLKLVYPSKESLYEAYRKMVGEEKAFKNKYRVYCMYAKF